MATNTRGVLIASMVVGLVFLLVALMPVGIGVWLYGRTSQFMSNAVHTTGTVIALHPHTDSDGSTMYKPEYEYQDRDGNNHRVTSSWSSNPPAYSVGDPVQVLYDPTAPGYGQIKSFWVQWIGPIISFGCASVPLALALTFGVVLPVVIQRAATERAVG